ncbi:hypothetical protein DIPPA_14477 [Diplonema papillatum]|nr:hypothetical protein DIPPA_14477 [Diplonema papillatum]
MMRRAVAPLARSAALQRRNATVLAYLTGFGGISSSTLLASPVGSILGSVLAYNVSVVGSHHIQYTMDLFFKDYIQDPVLYIACKYLTALCVILVIGQIFVEG